jgi:hypothetical protein
MFLEHRGKESAIVHQGVGPAIDQHLKRLIQVGVGFGRQTSIGEQLGGGGCAHARDTSAAEVLEAADPWADALDRE